MATPSGMQVGAGATIGSQTGSVFKKASSGSSSRSRWNRQRPVGEPGQLSTPVPFADGVPDVRRADRDEGDGDPPLPGDTPLVESETKADCGDGDQRPVECVHPSKLPRVLLAWLIPQLFKAPRVDKRSDGRTRTT